MNIEDYLSEATKRQIRRSTICDPMPNKKGFVTMHVRIPQGTYALVKALANENNISLSATSELIFLSHFKKALADQAHKKQSLLDELGVDAIK